ncbi:hypothetical protein B4Q04_18320 [Zobellia sp. OII3]|uniref:hypothetical protein n=1 Tax=Zobellia sp. OII3 TaxID=2034520 RepID=UPI000B532B59|nr:hypothetical protein [Zobellia sp. OII3]OWW24059.1 hypothetical protein B4Q04_18320 [Zobellia sp. OII3]
MVDYVKVFLLDVNVERLNNLTCLEFVSGFSERTGVIYEKKVAKYHNCKITVYETGKIIFSGSVHKLYNSLHNIAAPKNTGIKYRGFNGNLFTLHNFIEVMNHLTNLFDCKPEQMILQNIEIGANIEIDFDPKVFIAGLLFQNGQLFEFRYKRNFAIIHHQHYDIKIYNKSGQYGMTVHTIRVELKYKKMSEVKKIGIQTFADFTSCNFRKAFDLLLKKFDAIVYFDRSIRKDSLTKPQKKAVELYSNQNYWFGGIKPTDRDRPKKNLKKIIEMYSRNFHKMIREGIVKNCLISTQLPETKTV